MNDEQPIDEVVNCDVHEAYRVEFAAVEDVDWASFAAPDADGALSVWLKKDTEAGDTELLNLLKYEARNSFADQVVYAGLFGDGTTHASITASQQPGGEVWAVTHAVVCTLEEVPPEETEEENEFGYLEDDEIFEE